MLGSCMPAAHLTKRQLPTRISDASTYCLPLQSFVSDLSRLTQGHSTMKCYGLGLGLDTFRMVALTEHFRRLDAISLMSAYQRSAPHVASASFHEGRRAAMQAVLQSTGHMQVVLLCLLKQLVRAAVQSAL